MPYSYHKSFTTKTSDGIYNFIRFEDFEISSKYPGPWSGALFGPIFS